MDILVVEDSVSMQVLYKMIFADACRNEMIPSSTQVVYAKTAQEARQYLSGQMPRLLITDYTLPDATGEELIREVKERSTVPAILVTARTIDETLANVVVGKDAASTLMEKLPGLIGSLLKSQPYRNL